MTALRKANPDVVREDGPDPADGRWSQLEMLVASLLDDVRLLRHDYRTAHGDKKAEAPEPVRRPGVEGKRRKPRFSGAQADFLFRHINGLPQDPHSPVQLQVIDGGGGG